MLMKNLYIIYSCTLLFACSNSGNTTETFNESGEKVIVAENAKVDLALIEIGKACKEQGFTVLSRGGSLVMSDGTRIMAKCGKESNKSDKKVSLEVKKG